MDCLNRNGAIMNAQQSISVVVDHVWLFEVSVIKFCM